MAARQASGSHRLIGEVVWDRWSCQSVSWAWEATAELGRVTQQQLHHGYARRQWKSVPSSYASGQHDQQHDGFDRRHLTEQGWSFDHQQSGRLGQ